MLKITTTLLYLTALSALSGLADVRADVTGRVVERSSQVGIAGIAVSNGRDITLTDITGKYTLPSVGEFIYLTRTSSYVMKNWYLRIADVVNFEVARQAPNPPSEQDPGFFFIQISDAHVFDRKSDFAEFSSPNVPWYMPDFAVAWLTVNVMKRTYGENVIDRFRDLLRPVMQVGELEDMWDVSVYRAFVRESIRKEGTFGDYNEQIKSALAEVLGFNPEFIVNTGDLVLESNNGSAEAIDRWFQYYVKLTENGKTTFYNTIGNNEIAGTQRPEFTSDDPRFGKFFFKKYFGPTHFSFDHGPFHFVALDTHAADPQEDNPDFWNFGKMEPHISDWARADFKIHKNKVLIVLNHEPFHYDPVWPFEDNGSKADDEAMFREFGVDYVLSGHTHFRSYMQIDNIDHMTSGALSGFRWVLPASIHPRGYRLFYAKDRALFSAWKLTGESVVTLAEPQPEDQQYRVIGAADRHGAFDQIDVTVDGESIPVEHWGAYFFRIHLPDGGPKQIHVTVTSTDGTISRNVLAL